MQADAPGTPRAKDTKHASSPEMNRRMTAPPSQAHSLPAASHTGLPLSSNNPTQSRPAPAAGPLTVLAGGLRMAVRCVSNRSAPGQQKRGPPEHETGKAKTCILIYLLG